MTDMQPQPPDTTEHLESFAPPSGEPAIHSFLDNKGRPVGTFDRAMAAMTQVPNGYQYAFGAYTDEPTSMDRLIKETTLNEGLDLTSRFVRMNDLGFVTLALHDPEEGMKAASEFLDKPIPPGSGVNKDTKKTTDNLEEGKEVNLWTKLTPEQKTYAEEFITKMAEKFNRPKEYFGLVKSVVVDSEDNEIDVIKVMLIATKGIDLGDPSQPYDQKRNWKNTLATMKELNLSGLTLEDAKALAEANPEIGERFWLTGEAFKQDEERSKPFADVYGGLAFRCSAPGSMNSDSLAFRPAVTIN